MNVQQQDLSLSNCDREPIHELGHIQDFGALIAVNTDWFVSVQSANTAEVLGLDSAPAIGSPVSDVFDIAAFRRLRSAASALTDGDQVERLFGLDARGDGTLFDCAIHCSGDYTIIEIEHHTEGDVNRQVSMLRPVMSRLDKIQGSPTLLKEAARQLRTSLEMDRVMVYRFHADLSGEVVAEAKRGDLEPFHGLRYPKSDIPAQARELYLRNRFRIISDVHADPIPLQPGQTPEGRPLDLSMSTLRAVSPIHIEYLKNMGVDASLSISIVIGGKLWGMFACHHYSPKIMPYSQRTAAELFSELFSLTLERALFREQEALRMSGREIHDRLMRDIVSGTSLVESLPVVARSIERVIPHDGVSIYIEGQYDSSGSAPNEEEFRAVLPSLNSAASSRILSSDALGERFPAAGTFKDRAPGALVIPVSRNPRDYLIFWRRPTNRTVVWAGNPEKPVEYGPNGARLTPRKSFEAWQQSVEGRSAPWTDGELQVADGLRVSLLEIVLRLTDDAVQERKRAQQQQELLIAELNHRVRNILNLIRGLISQSRGDATSIEEFSEIVGGRIASLAAAHDNITKGNWSPAPLRSLIDSEINAYVAGKVNRVHVTGPKTLIQPEAYTVLALVIHELVTNSAKYGSLSDSRGRLDIGITRGADDALEMAWKESGGPPVKPPTRRGFGSTIVERSIPFELEGDTKVDYELSGLKAKLMVPSRYVEWPAGADEEAPGDRDQPANDEAAAPGNVPKTALLVEDSMIIALDTEDCLRELGVGDVIVQSSVVGALAALERQTPDFAILDYNLGTESSETVAEELKKRGITFWMATGYGDMSEKLDQLGANGLLTKPYGKDELVSLLAKMDG